MGSAGVPPAPWAGKMPALPNFHTLRSKIGYHTEEFIIPNSLFIVS
jgi:hypothetical protein